jgi:hypothetical protein
MQKTANSTQRSISASIRNSFICKSIVKKNIRIRSSKRKLNTSKDSNIPNSYIKNPSIVKNISRAKSERSSGYKLKRGTPKG